MYNASLNLGVALGAIVDGFIVRSYPWRYIYYIAIALIGFVTVVIYITFPETAYVRARQSVIGDHNDARETIHDTSTDTKGRIEHLETSETLVRPKPTTKDYLWHGLKLYNGTFTEEPLLNMALRPVMLLALPDVLWATLVMSVTIGFITAITSNVASAFSTAYGFAAWQSGLSFIAAVIGALSGMFLGGNFSDWVADFLTRRNGGIREPEFRLPAMMISIVAGPLALVLYGVGIEHKMHWIVPTIGIGLSKSPYPLEARRRFFRAR